MLLQGEDRRVVAEHVVADLRLEHRRAHLGRGPRHGVAAQVDRSHVGASWPPGAGVRSEGIAGGGQSRPGRRPAGDGAWQRYGRCGGATGPARRGDGAGAPPSRRERPCRRRLRRSADGRPARVEPAGREQARERVPEHDQREAGEQQQQAPGRRRRPVDRQLLGDLLAEAELLGPAQEEAAVLDAGDLDGLVLQHAGLLARVVDPDVAEADAQVVGDALGGEDAGQHDGPALAVAAAGAHGLGRRREVPGHARRLPVVGVRDLPAQHVGLDGARVVRQTRGKRGHRLWLDLRARRRCARCAPASPGPDRA